MLTGTSAVLLFNALEKPELKLSTWSFEETHLDGESERGRAPLIQFLLLNPTNSTRIGSYVNIYL